MEYAAWDSNTKCSSTQSCVQARVASGPSCLEHQIFLGLGRLCVAVLHYYQLVLPAS